MDEASRLPIEKVGKALSFIRYLNQENEPELLLDSDEEAELHELLLSGDFVEATEVLMRIDELPND